MVGYGKWVGDASRCAGKWHDSAAHVQRFFPPKVQKQMTVMSFDDITDVTLTYIRGRCKSKCT